MTVLKLKIYKITTCVIGYLRRKLSCSGKKITKIKYVFVEVKNIMIELETSSDSDNDKHNKHTTNIH